MLLKHQFLQNMEKEGIFYQERDSGTWHPGYKEDVDLTPYLIKAGLLYWEH